MVNKLYSIKIVEKYPNVKKELPFCWPLWQTLCLLLTIIKVQLYLNVTSEISIVVCKSNTVVIIRSIFSIFFYM